MIHRDINYVVASNAFTGNLSVNMLNQPAAMTSCLSGRPAVWLVEDLNTLPCVRGCQAAAAPGA
jgi:hypothetical protein